MTDAAGRLRADGNELRATFSTIDEAAITRRPPGGWSVWEIAYHLMDMERWFLAKVCEAASGSRAEALTHFVLQWSRLREDVATRLQTMPADRMDVPGLLSGVPGWTPRALLAVMAAHDREHLAQIRAAARGEEGADVPSGLIVHITEADAWERARAAGTYRAESLDTEGFIHCSTPEQAAETADRYFAGRSGLLLLVVDPAQLQPALVYEPATGGAQYPHVYGPLNLDAVRAVLPFSPGPDGRFSLPPEIATLS